MVINIDLWKKRRKELGLKYEDLAEAAKVSLNTVKNIFRGYTECPRIDTVQAIEKALGLDIAENTALPSLNSKPEYQRIYESQPEYFQKNILDVMKIFAKMTENDQNKAIGLMMAVLVTPKQGVYSR